MVEDLHGGTMLWNQPFCLGFRRPNPFFPLHLTNNPYKMDMMFIIADTLSKVMVLVLLSLWAILFKSGGLDWLITLFSVATLPNTLVMGIPLLQAMYGDYTQNLMVQLVVLQCIIWYVIQFFIYVYFLYIIFMYKYKY